MGEIKKHVCGNCANFGDNECMKNSANCEYADVDMSQKFHSTHYHTKGVEPIEFINSNELGFNEGSIVKYVTRVGKKEGQEVSDIKKIIDYSLLLAFQKGIQITREDVLDLINYRYDWRDRRNDV